jgi:acyl-CoA-binding protein
MDEAKQKYVELVRELSGAPVIDNSTHATTTASTSTVAPSAGEEKDRSAVVATEPAALTQAQGQTQTSFEGPAESDFEKAASDAKALKNLESNQRLQLYGLFKQSTEGDVSTQRPSMFDMVGRAKWYGDFLTYFNCQANTNPTDN